MKILLTLIIFMLMAIHFQQQMRDASQGIPRSIAATACVFAVVATFVALAIISLT